MNDRLGRVIRGCVLLLAAGLAYGGLCALAGRPLIPCPFYAVTGWYCPGCGVSRMCLALLRLDFAGAFRANRLLFLLLPLLGVAAVAFPVTYVRKGRWPDGPRLRILWGVLAAVLVGYGVLRNLPGFAWLQPM